MLVAYGSEPLETLTVKKSEGVLEVYQRVPYRRCKQNESEVVLNRFVNMPMRATANSKTYFQLDTSTYFQHAEFLAHEVGSTNRSLMLTQEVEERCHLTSFGYLCPSNSFRLNLKDIIQACIDS